MDMMPKIKRILAPTDFSPPAEQACSLAARLANRLEAGLIVFHAVPLVDLAREIEARRGRTRESVLSDAREGLQAWLEEAVPVEWRQYLAIEVQLAVGDPAQQIAAAAEGADLIVMGTRGRSGLVHLVMGSVTAAVLRTARVPVLALRAGQADRPLTAVKRILWATDLGPTSEAAWRYALLLADMLAAEIFLLHVVSAAQVVGSPGPPAPLPGEWLEAEIAARDRDLASKQGEVEGLGLAVRRKVTMGAPAATILAEAEAERADLIVMGTHGRRGLPHVLLGSVAEAVIRRAPCPVLAVQAPGS
ncbi:MAG: universal stress protein [candidate division NC10 bacterium]|nr:universal stress protein [candidate division NC10 bacterium]